MFPNGQTAEATPLQTVTGSISETTLETISTEDDTISDMLLQIVDGTLAPWSQPEPTPGPAEARHIPNQEHEGAPQEGAHPYMGWEITSIDLPNDHLEGALSNVAFTTTLGEVQNFYDAPSPDTGSAEPTSDPAIGSGDEDATMADVPEEATDAFPPQFSPLSFPPPLPTSCHSNSNLPQDYRTQPSELATVHTSTVLQFSERGTQVMQGPGTAQILLT